MTFAQAVVHVVGNWRKRYGDDAYVLMLVFMAVASGINTKRAVMKATLMEDGDVASKLRSLVSTGAIEWDKGHKKYTLTEQGKEEAGTLFSVPK